MLGLLDEQARSTAYEQSLNVLESSPHQDLDALKLCIKLRPPIASVTGHFDRLIDLVLLRIPQEPLDTDHFFRLAETLSLDGDFMDTLFYKRIFPELRDSRLDLTVHDIGKATAYLTIVKCTFWLPGYSNHVLDHTTLKILSKYLGSPDLDDVALDAISALLSLLRRGEPIAVAVSHDTSRSLGTSTGRVILAGRVVDECFWTRLSALGSEYFLSSRSASFTRCYYSRRLRHLLWIAFHAQCVKLQSSR